MILLTLDELLHVAERALKHPPVIRDVGLLEAALARPRASAFGSDAYPTIEAKAAAFVHSLVRNHALVDGDKRLGLAGLLVTLGLNGRRSGWTNDDAYDFIIDIAEGRLDDVEAIARRIEDGIRPAETSDGRPR